MKVCEEVDSQGNHTGWVVNCPGCKHVHVYDKRWTFNGDRNKPTFRASYLSKYTHPHGYTNENPAPVGYNGPYDTEVCHSFVTDGKIQFLSDCTHALAGQTVEIPDVDEWDKESN